MPTALSVNPAWTAVLQWSDAELIAQNPSWLVHPEDREKSQINRRTVGSTPLLFENRLRHKNGTYSSFSWVAVRRGERIYISARDISAMRRAQDDLRVSLNAIGEADRHTTMSEMTASIAHELNQPLSSIVTNGQAGLRWLVRPEPDLAEVRKVLDRVVADGERAAEVISSIRSIFGQARRDKGLLKVNDLICDVLALVHGNLENQHVALQMALSAGVLEVVADRVQLQQVLLNLFNNALEAMSSVAGRPGLLTVKSQVLEPSDVLTNDRPFAGERSERSNHPALRYIAMPLTQGFQMGEDCHESAPLYLRCIGWRCFGNDAANHGCAGQSRPCEPDAAGRNEIEDHHP
jgi:signal transduction histidine kinase